MKDQPAHKLVDRNLAIDGGSTLGFHSTIRSARALRNAVRNPKVALGICDSANPYNMAVIRGRVSEVTFNGAEERIDRMAKKYLGQEKYQMRQPGVRRVLIKIEPTHVTAPFAESSHQKAWDTRQK